MLNGMIGITSGDAEAFKLDVKDSMVDLRKIMGVCP
jgi:ABC-type multidrug transport system ATPase subunit